MDISGWDAGKEHVGWGTVVAINIVECMGDETINEGAKGMFVVKSDGVLHICLHEGLPL